MISVLRICRKCGGKIFSDAPEGLCSRCVLKSALGIFADTLVAAGDSSVVAVAKTDDGVSAETIAATPVATLSDKKTARAAKKLGELGDYELLQRGRSGRSGRRF